MNFYPTKDKYISYLIYVFVASIPLTETISNIVLILVLVTLIGKFDLNCFLHSLKTDSLFQIILAYFFLIVVLGAMREKTLQDCLFVLEVRVSFLLVPLLFFITSFREVKHEMVFQAFTLFVIVACIINLLLTITQSEPIESYYEFSWYLSQRSPITSNYLAMYSGFAIILIFNSFHTQLFMTKIQSTIAIIFLTGFLAVLGSRTAFFSTAFILVVLSSLRVTKKRKLIAVLLISLVSLVSLIAIVPYFKNRVTVLYTVGFEADPRYYEYRAALNILQKIPWFGLGLSGTKDALFNEYIALDFDEGIENRFNAHNQIFQTTLQFGIAGLISIVSLYSVCLVRSIRTRDPLAIAFSLLFIFCSLTESVFERNKGIVFFCFFSGLLLFKNKELNRDKLPQNIS